MIFVYILILLSAKAQNTSEALICAPTFTESKKCGWCSDYERQCHSANEPYIQCGWCSDKATCESQPNDCVWFDYQKTSSCRFREDTVYIGFLSFIILFLVIFLILSIVHRILREFHEEHENVFYFARMVRWVEGRADVCKGEGFWHSLARNITQYDPFMKFWVLDDAHYITLFEAYATWVFTFTYAGWASILVRLRRESNAYKESFQTSSVEPFLLVSLPCMAIFGISLAIEAMEQKVRLTEDDYWKEYKCSAIDIFYHVILLGGAVTCSVYGVEMIAHLYTEWYCVVWDLILWGWLVPEITGNTLTALKFIAAWEDQIKGNQNCFVQFCSRTFWKMSPITLSKRMSTEYIMMDWDETSSPYQWHLLGVNLHPDVAWHEDKTHLSDKITKEMEMQQQALESSRRAMPHGMQSFHCKHLSRRHWLSQSDVPRECWDLGDAADDNFGITAGMNSQQSLKHIASEFTLADGGFDMLEIGDPDEAENEAIITEFDEPEVELGVFDKKQNGTEV